METLFVKNALIYDGMGGKPYKGDMLVCGDTIAAIGAVPETRAHRVIDADGMALCPGFIDLHRHCDFAVFRPGFGALELAQGITTAVCGPCGMAAFPAAPQAEVQRQYADFLRPCLGTAPSAEVFSDLAHYASAVTSTGLPLHLGALVGAGAVQVAVNGFSAQPLSHAAMEKAQALIGDALDAGALGMSMGIMYVPECYLTRSQRLALLQPLRRNGTLFCHMRGEGDLLVDSVQETIDLAQDAQVPVQISHFKAVGAKNWGEGLLRAIERIEAARAHGCDVTVDFYPYTGGSTTLFSLVPPPLMAQGMQYALDGFSTAHGRKILAESLAMAHPNWDNMLQAIGPQRILLSSCPACPQLEGKSLGDICSLLDEPNAAACIGRILSESNGQASVILMSMHPDDLALIARLPYSMLISDALYPDTGKPHPRLYGSFPRFLQDFCGTGGMLPFETGVQKATMLPAQRAELAKRGVLTVGAAADFILFHEPALQSNATYTQPAQVAQGIFAAFVAGKQVWKGGALQTVRPGTFLCH